MSKTERFEAIKGIGCIVTLLNYRQGQGCDIHHLTAGGRRRGDEYTIGLSPYYHRGLCADGLTQAQTVKRFGPSLAHGKRTFEDTFGTQDLLLEVQNLVIKQYLAHYWSDYDPPYEVRRRAIHLWTDKRKCQQRQRFSSSVARRRG